jgi:formate dehydrogenase iron-sulfur subunit
MNPSAPVSRRAFCKTGLVLMTAGAAATPAFAEHATVKPADQVGVLVDLSRCVGCRACEHACLVRQKLPGLPPASFGYGAGEGKLTFKTRTFVDFPTVTSGAGQTQKLPVKRQCMHCLDPACVSVCPVAALEKSPRGAVIYREERCIGCRYCILACPFGVPRYEWDNALSPRVNKCDLCDDRIANGQSPACVAACPTGTLKFGKREALLTEAQQRMSAQPKRYAALLGKKIVGGTAWLYLSDTPLERLGFPPDLPKEPMPMLTWKALSKVPYIVIGVALALSAVFRWRSAHTKHA